MKIQKFLSHLCIIGAAMAITLLIVDFFNPSMDFINNTVTKGGLAVLCVAVLCLSVSVLAKKRVKRK